MSEEENVQELIQPPHGVQESIKMDLLEWIQNYLTATAKDDTVSEEERARLNFSVKAHERKIAELKKQD